MTQDTEVLYNAQCPVCSFEINHYRAYADKRALPVRFDDLNGCDLSRWGLSANQAARRLYVRQGDQLLSGIPAFILLWRQMPRYRVLAKMASLPGIHRVSCMIYDHALAPLIYRWHLRRQAKAGIAAPSK